MSVCVYVYMCTCVFVCMLGYCMYMCIFMHLCVCTYMHAFCTQVHNCMYTCTHARMHVMNAPPLVALLSCSPAVQSRGRGSRRWCEGAACGPRRSGGRGSVHCCLVPPSPPRTTARGWLSCQCPCRWPPT